MNKNLLILFSLILFSCNKIEVYKNIDRLDDKRRWEEKDAKSFDFEISEDSNYKITLLLGHLHDIQIDEFKSKINLVNQEQNIFEKNFDIKLNYNDCLGDVCDSKLVIEETINLKKGNYTIKIAPISKYGFIPNMTSIGLLVEKK